MRRLSINQPINGGNAAKIFSAALERMGLERVSQLGMRLSGIPLVSRHPVIGYQSQIQKSGWYITTHASNTDKKRMLEKISETLQIPAHIEIEVIAWQAILSVFSMVRLGELLRRLRQL
ncbi:hypothetical protein [Nitrosospira sp. Is2]|uniref:hypothetical protein n=1 Tax=Nitrosospira sp. Is2 TaxID=3080532 RepID=UPI002952C488|nr:hypothetical protein [Nitrosospira sp. Is2]WON75329.1 hypothetical protein R5L00_07605 [Nitrosospira sp. Is2]